MKEIYDIIKLNISYKYYMRKIIQKVILSLIWLPNIMYGAEGGLVQCGVGRDCTVCDMFILVRDIMNFLFQLLGVMAVISIVIGGFYMVISSGDQGKYKQGVDIIKNAILGIVLTLSAFIMFNFILVGLGFQVSNIGFGGGGTESDALQFEQEGEDFSLFRVKCDSTSYFLAREVNLGGAVSGSNTGATGTGNSSTVGAENVACLELSDSTASDGVKAVMRTINFYEHTNVSADSYYIAVGGSTIKNTPNFHPRKITASNSTAYGRYQMIDTTWTGWAAAAGIPKNVPRTTVGRGSGWGVGTMDYDMSPANQDLAVAKFLNSKGLTDCEAFNNPANKINEKLCQWASIKGCSQPNNKTNTTDANTICKKMMEDEVSGKCK